MKSLVKGIFICLFAIFLMSHNAFAADIVNDDVSLFNSVTSLQFSCSVNGSNFIQNTGLYHRINIVLKSWSSIKLKSVHSHLEKMKITG